MNSFSTHGTGGSFGMPGGAAGAYGASAGGLGLAVARRVVGAGAGAGLGGGSALKVGRGIQRYLRDRMGQCTIFNGCMADFCFLACCSKPFFRPILIQDRRLAEERGRGLDSLGGGDGEELFSPNLSYRFFV